jgi:hypothetical protein
MASISIKDLPLSRTLDHDAMAGVRGAGGGGSWVVGWIAPFVEHSQSSGGMGYGTAVYNITNNIFTQVINAAQATFQTQNTDVFNSGANAIVDVGPNQASAISRT